MKQIIKFEIECGEKTCASEPRKFCRFFHGNFGKDTCLLFGRVWDDESGWVQRHPDCIKNVKEK